MGAASKGIIQRDHQHNAVVYKQTYASNPFNANDEDDLARYQKQVNQKAGGERESHPCIPSSADMKCISVLVCLQPKQRTGPTCRPVRTAS